MLKINIMLFYVVPSFIWMDLKNPILQCEDYQRIESKMLTPYRQIEIK